MEARLKTVLALSLVGGALILLLWAAKPLTRRLFGSRWQYYIWLAALLVMVLPVRIPLPGSLPVTVTVRQEFSPQQPAQPVQTPQAPAENPHAALAEQPAPSPNPLLENGQVGAPNGISFPLFWLIGAVWLTGCLVFAGIGLADYVRFLQIVRKHAQKGECPMLAEICAQMGIHKAIAVKTTAVLDAPMLTGVFRPVLLLPRREIDARQMRYILLHELTHYKRRDLWYKWFAFLVNALHWFNPLVYVAVRQINEDCELSCDLAVTAHMSEEEKAGYMGTILQLAAQQQKEGKG